MEIDCLPLKYDNKGVIYNLKMRQDVNGPSLYPQDPETFNFGQNQNSEKLNPSKGQIFKENLKPLYKPSMDEIMEN